MLSWFYRQNSRCPERLSDYTGSYSRLEIAESVNAVAFACLLSAGSDLSIANKDWALGLGSLMLRNVFL